MTSIPLAVICDVKDVGAVIDSLHDTPAVSIIQIGACHAEQQLDSECGQVEVKGRTAQEPGHPGGSGYPAEYLGSGGQAPRQSRSTSAASPDTEGPQEEEVVQELIVRIDRSGCAGGYRGTLGGSFYAFVSGPTFESVLDCLLESLYDQMGYNVGLCDD